MINDIKSLLDDIFNNASDSKIANKDENSSNKSEDNN